ncbi:hypothetical protein GOP47_0004557 [Adiantum capillus-veneris]|uniref:1-phosphatidylinositol 4-kinase n=1 Tax=Adiantum capillus-veneris TaxID=13818 RepID=A0A9D4V7S1_ADICA|nr:hypothetical protein GOP47_0004557 [Adiantum capillus-veneris]
MPPSVESPVQARIPIPVPDGVLGSGKKGSGGVQTRPVGRRRIFVQTDTGSVLGIELDRADNAQTVKKKMQAMLNVPTEQTALMFGDTVFKGDLSEVRNDSPLLLTRELQRSLSTPCIYPSSDVQVAMDGGQPFEVVGGVRCCPKMKRILKQINKAINCGVEPVAVSGGLGGAYYFRNTNGDSVAIVKPTDEEPFAPNNPKGYIGRSLGQPGLKKTVRVGETGVREVAAYLLDHENFAKVPPTALVKVAHHAFHVNGASTVRKGQEKGIQPVSKIASCQQFVHHDYDASDHGTSRFSVAAVHRIGILDIRIFNTDRHAGNILIRNNKSLDNTWSYSNVHVNESLELIPIDHGLCLPEALEDPYFEWLHWPQASVPFSEEELDYIKRLDQHKDADVLRRELPMLREVCFRMLILSTTLLKRAAAAGLCLAEIGEMMSRDGLEEASELELLCMQAKFEIETELLGGKLCCDDGYEDAAISEVSVGEDLHEQFEFEMDHEFDHKLNFMSNDYQLFPTESDCVGLDQSIFPLLPDLPAPAHDFNFSPRALHPSRIPLQIWPDASALEEDGYLGSSRKVLDGGSSLWNGRIEYWQKLIADKKSDMKSPRGARAERSPRLCAEFCPLTEEEEVLVFADNDTKTNDALQDSDLISPRAMSLRSVSFHNRKQRYLDGCEHRMPASETTGKNNANGGSPPFSLADMSEKEWILFMGHFEGLLEEALANRPERSVNHRQRLGISCQF